MSEYSGEKKRCPNCEHEAIMHSEGGCWFTLKVGQIDQSLVCKCPLTRELVDRAGE